MSYNEGLAGRRSNSEGAAPPRRSVVRMIEDQVARGQRTLTPLPRKLLDARRRIEESGVPLLDDAELEKEKAERRGGVTDI